MMGSFGHTLAQFGPATASAAPLSAVGALSGSAADPSHRPPAVDARGAFGVFTIECKGFRRDRRFLRVDARPYLAVRRRTVADLTLEALTALDCNATGREALFMYERGWWKAFPDEPICDLFDEGCILLLVSDPCFDPPAP